MVLRSSYTPSHAGLQQLCATPKRTSGASVSTRDTLDVRSSRYRLLDPDEQAQQTQEVERIIEELKLQRRPRPGSATRQRKPSQERRGSASSSRRLPSPKKTMSPQRSPTRDGSQTPPPPYDFYNTDDEGYGDESLPMRAAWTDEEDDDEDGAVAVATAPSNAFQDQVLEELQRLKQAQMKDLEAIRKLQQEKEDAEQRAKRLAKALKQSQSSQGSSRDGALSKRRSRDSTSSSIASSSRVHKEDFYNDQGDESAPPIDQSLDWTDGSDDEVHERVKPMPQWTESSTCSFKSCTSPVVSKRARPSSAKRESTTRSRSASQRTTESDDELDDSRGRSRSRTPSSSMSIRERSASREALRRSCSFYEEKRRAQEEEEARQREEQRRLERAARATPPANLLKRQEEAQRRKESKLYKVEKELTAELSPTKRVKARDVPLTTYVTTDSFATDQEREQARKERLLKRSQDILAASELPARMKRAQEEEAKAQAARDAAIRMGERQATNAMTMSVKLRKQLRTQAEEDARRRAMKPKPVPDFNRLQQKWEKTLSVKKSKTQSTTPEAFFASRAQELEDLKARKEARRKKMEEKEAEERAYQLAQQQQLLERTKAKAQGRDGPRLTKSEELRIKKIQEALRKAQREREQEQIDAELRALRLKEASKRVAAQVRDSEEKRKGEYAGDFVELTSVESVAKQRAKEQRDKFKEAIQRNKEKILMAVSTRPSLMERFTTELKREEHKKNALEAVVKNVFQGNFKAMKGILSEEEEDLARDLVAADRESGDGDEDEQVTSKKKRKEASEEGDYEHETYDD